MNELILSYKISYILKNFVHVIYAIISTIYTKKVL